MKTKELEQILTDNGWQRTAMKSGWTHNGFAIAQADTGEFVCSSKDNHQFPMPRFLAEYDSFEGAVRHFLDEVLRVEADKK